MINNCTIDEYFQHYASLPLIDVRSAGEYEQGHIQHAINFPLLNNDERSVVGTCYKQQGHKAAVIKGFELVGGKFADYIVQFEKLTTQTEIVVHCWRGGLRSNIMAWLLEKGGYKPILLKGGYKAYRNWAIDKFSEQKKLLILGGKTGSHKTKILQQLKTANQCVIDLEMLANHRGSAFGGIGLGAQPTQEQFENNLASALNSYDNSSTIWIENESRLIGKCILPTVFFETMKQSPIIELEVNRSERAKNIIDEYGAFDRKLLVEKTMGIEKKLGNQNMRNSIAAILDNDYNTWVNYLLDYYDKTYQHSKERNGNRKTILISYSSQNNIDELIALANSLN